MLYACACVQVIPVDGRPGKLIYVQSTDQVWVQQQQGDDDAWSEVVVIRQAGEHLLHRAVHVDYNQQLGPFTVRLPVDFHTLHTGVMRQHYDLRVLLVRPSVRPSVCLSVCLPVSPVRVLNSKTVSHEKT